MPAANPSDDPLGQVPFPPASATEVLTQPRWAYLLFEFNITEHELGERDGANPFLVPGITADELAGHVEIDPTVLRADLQALADLGVLRQDDDLSGDAPSDTPTYQSQGYQLFPDDPIDLPDGGTTGHLPPQVFGAVGYGYHDAAVPRFLHQYSYDQFVTAVRVFHKIMREESVERTLEQWFPDVSDGDVTSIRPALKYAYGRLSDDPVWGWEYPVEPP